MKLYATTTGYKDFQGQKIPVSKGQGSNSWLKISLQDENEKEILVIVAYVRNDGNIETAVNVKTDDGYEEKWRETYKIEGKKQKGEKEPRKCEHYGCGNYAEPDSEYCIAH